MKNHKCILCGHDQFEELINFGKHQVKKCKSCELVYLYPLPKKLPPGDDYANLDLRKFFKYLKKIRLNQYRKDINFIKKKAPGVRLLDVGCAQGWFLQEAEKCGFSAEGIEPSPTVIRWARKYNPKASIIHGEFLSLKNRLRRYDAITFWSVLEHLIDPVAALRLSYKKLNYDGVVAIRTPNFAGLIPQVIILISKISFGKINKPARSLYEYDCDYKHFFHFSVAPLRRLLEKAGFKIIKIEKNLSLDISRFDERIKSSRRNDLRWASKFPVQLGIRLIIWLSKILKLEDEVVVFARKVNHG